jgi:hypothetical protein
MSLHLQAYAFVHPFIFQKTILDAACGTCFGSMIYSTGAAKIFAIDKDAGAIKHGKKLKFFCPVDFMVRDLDKDMLPEADVCVSVETIEHLNGNGFFLNNLRTKYLIFTIPINMGGPYHKLVFKDSDEAIDHLRQYGWIAKSALFKRCEIPMVDSEHEYILTNDMLMGIAERA